MNEEDIRSREDLAIWVKEGFYDAKCSDSSYVPEELPDVSVLAFIDDEPWLFCLIEREKDRIICGFNTLATFDFGATNAEAAEWIAEFTGTST